MLGYLIGLLCGGVLLWLGYELGLDKSRLISQDELMAMSDEVFVQEYDKYRAEALRRAR